MNKARVLHIEDNDGDADLVMLALDRASDDWRTRSKIIRARDFAEGITAVMDERPHVLLLDINLPGRSGHDLLAKVKSHRATRHIPVIILSTSADKREIAMCYRQHASAYLTKPTTFKGLVDMMLAVEQFWLRIAQLPTPPNVAERG
jgi:CheY-like chemotaxis protein